MSLPLHHLNWVDRFIGVFSPQAALARLPSRMLMAGNRPHEAAESSPYRKSQRNRHSPDQIVGLGAEAVRAQARHLERNSDITRGILKTLTHNIVGAAGIGIEFQPRREDGSIHKEYAKLLMDLWEDFSKRPEVTHTYTESQMERMACNTWLRDGEVFAQEIIGFNKALDHGTRVPYSLELFEADFVPMSYDDGDRVRQGIEYDAWKRQKAFWVHKGQPLEAAGFLGDATGLKRVEAYRIIHAAIRDRIGQGRGISALATIITRMEDVKDYEESERIAAKIAAALTAYVKKGGDSLFEASNGQDAQGNPKPRDLFLSPGTVIDSLRPGEEIGLISSNRPNPNLITFRQGQLKAMSAGVLVSYSSAARDYNGTYSAQRQEMVEQAVHYACMTDDFVAQFKSRVVRGFINASVLSGLAPVPKDVKAGTFDDVLYTAQAMPWIDPLKEAQAYELLCKAGFASEVEVLRKRGVRPQDVMEQMAQWRDMAQEKGLVLTSDASSDANYINATKPAQAQPQQAEDTKALMMSMASRLIQAAAPAPAPASPIHLHSSPVTVNTPASEVHAHIQVPPSSIQVDNHVQPTPIQVDAHVSNQITAQAGETKVVMQHPVSAIATHERDSETQEIVATRTEYTTQTNE